MKELERKLAPIARSGLPLLIEAECGTGKETLAEFVHELSGIGGDFVRVLCRPSTLAAGFAGNGVPRPGVLYGSARGSLFLKDVHLLPRDAQQELLAAMEQRAGAAESRTAPRLISSAAENLEESVARREFLAELYYRLSVHRIALPPLRERIEDVPELLRFMIARAGNGAGSPPELPSHVVDALMRYNWPGNLRELDNMARAYAATGEADDWIAQIGGRTKLALGAAASAAGSAPHLSLKEQVRGAAQRLETEIILRTLERHRWNRRRAAESLRISYRALLYKMKNCNLRMEPAGADREEQLWTKG